MGQIRMFLIDAEHPEAVSLLRAARYAVPKYLSCTVEPLNSGHHWGIKFCPL